MPSYRLNCRKTSRPGEGSWFEAPNDDRAFEIARAMHPDEDCELWRGTTKLGSTRRDGEER